MGIVCLSAHTCVVMTVLLMMAMVWCGVKVSGCVLVVADTV